MKTSIYLYAASLAFEGLAGGGVHAAMAAAAPSGPSFDCARAATPIEKAICGDGEATAQDRDLALLYKRTLAARPDDAARTVLRDSQRAWMKSRDAACLSPPPPQTVALCLRGLYDKRMAELHSWGLPRLRTSAMPDAALDAAYGADRDAWEIVAGAFSPDGQLFAFSTGNDSSSGTVWLYDRGTRRLFAATPVLRQGTTATIERFFWVGQTLYGEGEYGATDGPSQPLRFAATTAGGRDVDTLPPAAASPGEAKDTTSPDGYSGERQEEDAYFVVASVAHGHGAFSLTASDNGPKGREWTLQTGGWELGDYVFDAPRKRVLYMASEGLVVYDLSARKAVNFSSPPGKVLGVSPDGKLAALAVYGGCDASSGPIPAGIGRVHICFAELP